MSEILNETSFSMFGSEVLLGLDSPDSEASDDELTVEEVDEQIAEVIARAARPTRGTPPLPIHPHLH
jgi:uncharacterized protein (UPF0254 family)